MGDLAVWGSVIEKTVRTMCNIIAWHTSNVLRHAESVYYKNAAMGSFINQVLFFMLCDRFFCPEDRLTSLYSLLFYNVIGYLVVYARRLLSLHDYSPIVRVSEHTNIKHLAMTATKVVLDLAKVVTFAITCVFMLLVFGLEQGLEHFNPTWGYIAVTGVYFILSEPKCQKNIPDAVIKLHFERLESLEHLWSPVLLHLFTSLLSVLFITIVWFFTDGGWVLIFSSSYINVYLGLRIMGDSWQELLRERGCLEKYRHASKEELSEKDDVCAVCLQAMKYARITPCNHMFHGACLRRWLKLEITCPLCKQSL